MKNTTRFILLAMMTTSLFAAENAQNQQNNNRQQGNSASYATACVTAQDNAIKNFYKDPKNVGKSYIASTVPVSTCDNHKVVAELNKQAFDIPSESKVTADNLVQCKKDGGYTVDYSVCSKTANLYDAVIVAEKLMMTAQSVKVSESNIAANKEVAKRSAEGDAQNAAIDATIARNQLNAKLYKTQAITYGAAVAALSAQMPSWLMLKKTIAKRCETAPPKETFTGLTSDLCKKSFASVAESSVVFANNDAKTKFMTAMGSFIKKAADAAKQAGVSEEVAAKLKNVTPTEDDTDVTLDACFVNPDSADCKATTGRGTTTTSTFKGNSVDFGASAGQTFDFTGSDGTIGSDDSNGVTDGTEKVTDVSSPFEDAAKAAKGILNPASAAQIGPGAAGAGAAAGGGGGGGGGGGHASLGNDLTGAAADSNKDPDINTNKLSGKYKEGKAAGFQAVKGGSDDANPFASMFDAKGEAGGIEEDRSIASDISGESSGLFEKISKKYGQVQQEKRVESQNLE